MKKYLPSIILLIVFEAIAIFLWLTKDNLFYLLNFSYIGGYISIGLALLVYKHPKETRKNLGFIRYITFALALALVSGLFLAKAANLERVMFWLFIAGNVLYYVVGITLAYAFKDNRAFCKYICPIAVFLKPMSYYSILRVHCDESKCINCGKCLKLCPMNVEVNKESRKRKNGTECILCYECRRECPVKALH